MDWNTKVIEEFRANKGVVGGQFNGMELLLLTSIGANSGNKYTKPLAYSIDGDKYIIVASKGGAPTNPDWYHNLIKNPEATIEVGDRTIKVRAALANDQQREELFDKHAVKYPAFNGYKETTTRKIPVFILEEIN